jgi:hypothetical protein
MKEAKSQLEKVREFLNSMIAVLSTGQQFRAALARTLAEALTDRRLVVFDEYTSVADRTLAQTCSHALQKTVRHHKLQCIAVTCHDDVTDWLQPDWTYEPAENRFAWRSLRRPVWSKNSNEGYQHGRFGLACGLWASFGLKQRSREAVQRLGFAMSGGRPAIQARTGPETPGAFPRRMNGAKHRVGSNSAGWGKSLASGLEEDLSRG